MKKALFILVFTIAGYGSSAQNVFPLPSGNVGIGTNNPVNALTVIGNNGALNPGHTATFSSNLGSANIIGNQINVTNLHTNWGLLVGFDGGGVANTVYHYPYGSYLVNVQNGPLNFGTNNALNMTITPNGNVGIGTSSPNVALNISKYGNNVADNMTLLTTFTDPTGIKGISLGYNQSSQAGIIYSENNTGVGSPLEFWTYNGNSFASRMIFTQSGNLGIGTQAPDAKLAVNGTIHSKEVKVDMNVLPDYVFKPTYNLAALKEVKSYIDLNHHLPEVPSAQQVAKEGLNLGEMNATLLKKIEELTLYLIEKDKQVSDQNSKLADQQKEIEQLKQQQTKTTQQETRIAKLEKAIVKLTETSK